MVLNLQLLPNGNVIITMDNKTFKWFEEKLVPFVSRVTNFMKEFCFNKNFFENDLTESEIEKHLTFRKFLVYPERYAITMLKKSEFRPNERKSWSISLNFEECKIVVIKETSEILRKDATFTDIILTFLNISKSDTFLVVGALGYNPFGFRESIAQSQSYSLISDVSKDKQVVIRKLNPKMRADMITAIEQNITKNMTEIPESSMEIFAMILNIIKTLEVKQSSQEEILTEKMQWVNEGLLSVIISLTCTLSSSSNFRIQLEIPICLLKKLLTDFTPGCEEFYLLLWMRYSRSSDGDGEHVLFAIMHLISETISVPTFSRHFLNEFGVSKLIRLFQSHQSESLFSDSALYRNSITTDLQKKEPSPRSSESTVSNGGETDTDSSKDTLSEMSEKPKFSRFVSMESYMSLKKNSAMENLLSRNLSPKLPHKRDKVEKTIKSYNRNCLPGSQTNLKNVDRDIVSYIINESTLKDPSVLVPNLSLNDGMKDTSEGPHTRSDFSLPAPNISKKVPSLCLDMVRMKKVVYANRSIRRQDVQKKKTVKDFFDTDLSSTEKLINLARQIGQTMVAADLNGILPYRQSALRPSLNHGVLMQEMGKTSGTDANVSNEGRKDLRYFIRCYILKTLSILSNDPRYSLFAHNLVNFVYCELIKALNVSKPDEHYLKSLFAVLQSNADMVEVIHTHYWKEYTRYLTLEKVLKRRKKLDSFVWRIHNQLYSCFEVGNFEYLYVQLSALANYLKYCTSRVMASQVVDVCMQSLLLLKKYLMWFKMGADCMILVNLFYLLLKVMDQISVQCRKSELNDLLLTMWAYKRKNWDFVREFAALVLKDHAFEREILKEENGEDLLSKMRIQVIEHYDTILLMIARHYKQSSIVDSMLSSDKNKKVLLNRFEFIIRPQSILQDILQRTTQYEDFELKHAILRFLHHLFSMGSFFALNKVYIDCYIPFHYLQFIKLYNNYALDEPTLVLARDHLKILTDFAIRKNKHVVLKFYQLRVVDFLAWEINLEYEINARIRKYAKEMSKRKSMPFGDIHDGECKGTAVRDAFAAHRGASLEEEPDFIHNSSTEEIKSIISEGLISKLNLNTTGVENDLSARGEDGFSVVEGEREVVDFESIGHLRRQEVEEKRSEREVRVVSKVETRGVDEGENDALPRRPNFLLRFEEVKRREWSEDEVFSRSQQNSTAVESMESKEETKNLSWSVTTSPFKPSLVPELGVVAMEPERQKSVLCSEEKDRVVGSTKDEQIASIPGRRSIVPRLDIQSLKRDPSFCKGSGWQDMDTITESVAPLGGKDERVSNIISNMSNGGRGENLGSSHLALNTLLKNDLIMRDFCKLQVFLNRHQQEEVRMEDGQDVWDPVGSVELERELYRIERDNRKLYADLRLHCQILKLLFILLLSKDGYTLNSLYIEQYPLSHNKINIPYILWMHLNHPTNHSILAPLCNSTLKMRHSAFRLLKLMSMRFFQPSLYCDLVRIAEGAYGTVYSAKLLGETVAVKLMELPSSFNDRCVLHDIFTEILILDRWRADNRICQIIDYGIDERNYWIVMRKYRTSLKDWRKHQKKSLQQNLPLYLNIYLDLLHKCRFLVENNINHYDIKCDNFLIDPIDPEATLEDLYLRSGRTEKSIQIYEEKDDPYMYHFAICIADFGESLIYNSENRGYTMENCGTEFIKSPEMLMAALITPLGPQKYERWKRIGAGKASDVWSLGCLLYELLTGEFMFHNDDWMQFWVLITSKDEELITTKHRESLLNMRPLINFLQWVLIRDPEYRPTIEEMTEYFIKIRVECLKEWEARNSMNGDEIISISSFLNESFDEIEPYTFSAIGSRNMLINDFLFNNSLSSFLDSKERIFNSHSNYVELKENEFLIFQDDYSISEYKYFEWPSKITEHLWLGYYSNLDDCVGLKNKYRITHIVNCTSLPNKNSNHFNYLAINVGDGSPIDLSKYYQRVMSFYRDCINNHGSLLVACQSNYKGTTESRPEHSPSTLLASSLIVAIVMQSENMSFFGALKHTFLRRYISRISLEYAQQLVNWGVSLTLTYKESSHYLYTCLCNSNFVLLNKEKKDWQKLRELDCNCNPDQESNCPLFGCSNFVKQLSEAGRSDATHLEWIFLKMSQLSMWSMTYVEEFDSIELMPLWQRKQINKKEWRTYRCRNCNFITHAVHKSEETLWAVVTNIATITTIVKLLNDMPQKKLDIQNVH